MVTPGKFQSPSGVLGVCRKIKGRHGGFVSPAFQSPSGVLGVCRLLAVLYAVDAIIKVSVPFRGFRGLQVVAKNLFMDQAAYVSVPFRGFRGLQAFNQLLAADEADAVSVPFRGFRGLQVDLVLLDEKVAVEFQSPCGVLGVCRPRRVDGRLERVPQRFSPLAGF